jgi:hypothetical protein
MLIIIVMGQKLTRPIQSQSFLHFLDTRYGVYKARLKNNDDKGSAYYFTVRKLLSFYLLSRVLYKTIAVLFVLYGCETWSVTFLSGHKS